jgi:cytochrome c peroxidase
MLREYTCSNCRYAGSLTDEEPGSGSAEPTCPRCGARVDTISATPAEEATKHEKGPPKVAPPANPALGGAATIDWKSEASRLPIPGYKVLFEIGRGGMGVVYKAREQKLNRIVALKMIVSGRFTSVDLLARFRTETQIVAQLQHPNIMQIYEVGEFEGTPYCAFEYMDGGSLSTKVGREPQPSREAAQLIETLARAMHSAHLRGIVHRDLKPGNILLTTDGLPKIADFGLAKRLESESGQTQTGSILGTPSYMAPEQAAGKTKRVGPSADVWALGAILYHLLTGQPPFQGITMLDTLEQVRNRDPVPPSRNRPKLPRDLETICLKCLEKNPADRYDSAEALADDLRRFLDNEPIHARPVGRLEALFRKIKRRPTTAALVGLLFVVATLLAWSLVWLWRLQTSPRQPAAQPDQPYQLKVPRGLPSLSIPSDNPLTEARVALGKQLFFDKRLSRDNSVSCASCHDPSRGWSNGQAVAQGIGGQLGKRSVPSIVNVTYHTFLFWDGRAGSLEEQAQAPILNSSEMAMPTMAEVEARLGRIEGYRQQFQRAFGSDVTAANVAKALAAFERTILSGNAPYDRYKAGETDALSEAALRGLKLFFHKAHCAACHSGPNFSDGAFHNIGISSKDKDFDVGRQEISSLLGDRGSFRTPSLREVYRTAPYMHNGSLKTLKEVINHYDRGGISNPQLDEEIYPLKLTAQEKRDLVVFLREGLTSSAYPFVSPPTLPD